jgi:hypothetical protein
MVIFICLTSAMANLLNKLVDFHSISEFRNTRGKIASRYFNFLTSQCYRHGGCAEL